MEFVVALINTINLIEVFFVKINRLLFFSMAIGAALLISGCAKQTNPSSNVATTSTKEKAPATAEQKEVITIYYPDKMGEKLIPFSKTIHFKNKQDKYKLAVEALLEQAPNKDVVNIMPKGTKVINVTVTEKGIAKVNFTPDFIHKFSGGSTGELMLVGSIVDTLTNFSNVKGVLFYVDGKPIDAISGHLDLSQPTKRMTNIL